jgi:hypothetical protein
VKVSFNHFASFYLLTVLGLLSDHKFLDYMRTRNYTVGFSESFDSCALAVFRLLDIKSIHETCAFPLTEPTALAHGMLQDFRHIPGKFKSLNYCQLFNLVFENYEQQGPIRSFFDVLYNFYYYLFARFQNKDITYRQTVTLSLLYNSLISSILGRPI